MRKSAILGVCIALSVFFTACKKENNSNKEVQPAKTDVESTLAKSLVVDNLSLTNVNLKLVEEVENMPGYLLSLAYMNLNADEKVVFWKRHVSNYLAANQVTDEFKQLLIKGLEVNRSEYFNSTDSEKSYTFSKYSYVCYQLPLEKGQFTAKQLNDVFTLKGFENSSIQILKSGLKLNLEDGGGGGDVGDVGEGGGETTAVTCDCRYSIYCYPNTCDAQKKCKTNTTCGIWGNEQCTGKCNNPTPQN